MNCNSQDFIYDPNLGIISTPFQKRNEQGMILLNLGVYLTPLPTRYSN